eukprot:4233611-Amphidinium_carterae.2
MLALEGVNLVPLRGQHSAATNSYRQLPAQLCRRNPYSTVFQRRPDADKLSVSIGMGSSDNEWRLTTLSLGTHSCLTTRTRLKALVPHINMLGLDSPLGAGC